jgi:TIR domain
MAEPNTQPPRWTFVSYPRKDRPFVRRFSRDLERAGLRTWVDAENLQPGTDNWQRTIRQAVSGSHAIILVCTPNTAESPFVHAELLLAQQAGRTVLPIWADGENWIDCIPLELANYQYIDVRGESYELGLIALVNQLRKQIAAHLPTLLLVDNLEACPNGYIPIVMSRVGREPVSLKRATEIVAQELLSGRGLSPDLNVIATNPAAFQYMEDLLQSIYTLFLRERFALYTYGSDWLLAKPSAFCSFLALPWEWLEHERMPAIPAQLSYRTPLFDCGFGGTLSGMPVWAIVSGKNLGPTLGVLTSDAAFVASRVAGWEGKSLSFSITHGKKHALGDVNPAAYRFRFVVAWDDFPPLDPVAERVIVLRGGVPRQQPSTTPCPFCGQPLRTSKARQCPWCHRSWHNPPDANNS